eukprot:2469652-Prymnesium_polylepis.1
MLNARSRLVASVLPFPPPIAVNTLASITRARMDGSAGGRHNASSACRLTAALLGCCVLV